MDLEGPYAAALDAAARAVFTDTVTRVGYPTTKWEDPRLDQTRTREDATDRARVALDAALPILRAKLATTVRTLEEERRLLAEAEIQRAADVMRINPRTADAARGHSWALRNQADGLREAANMIEGSAL